MAEAALDSGEDIGDVTSDVVPDKAPVVPITTEVDKVSEEKPVEAKFPENWRELMANGDEKALGQLKRFTTPENVLKSLMDTRAKLSSGQYKTALPENATEDQVAAWRAENGIPEDHKGYKIDLGEGMVLGEEDAPIADSFMEFAHKSNMAEKDVNTALKWYYEWNDQLQQQQYETDATFKEESIQELRNEWGPEFKANLNAINTVLGDELSDLLFSARSQDGTILGNHPAVLKALAQIAKDANPAATLIPGAGANILSTVTDEIQNIESMMGNRASEYWKGPKSETLQQRYRDLLTARDRLAGR